MVASIKCPAVPTSVVRVGDLRSQSPTVNREKVLPTDHQRSQPPSFADSLRSSICLKILFSYAYAHSGTLMLLLPSELGLRCEVMFGKIIYFRQNP